MLHLAPRALAGTLLFHDWTEAHALWTRLVQTVPDPLAICVMPDHVHVVAARDVRSEVRDAARAFARWRNHRRGQLGPVWRPLGAPEVLADRQHVRRMVRYVHLNPCRAELVADPLAWPYSTHRDAVGLAWRAVRPRDPDPEGFHAWVSGDPSVRVEGTLLPWAAEGRAPVARVRAAVSAVCRVPAGVLDRRSEPRTLLVHAAVELADCDGDELAARLGVSRRTLQRAAARPPREIDLVRRVLRDPRFAALPEGDLRARWPAKYARKD